MVVSDQQVKREKVKPHVWKMPGTCFTDRQGRWIARQPHPTKDMMCVGMGFTPKDAVGSLIRNMYRAMM